MVEQVEMPANIRKKIENYLPHPLTSANNCLILNIEMIMD